MTQEVPGLWQLTNFSLQISGLKFCDYKKAILLPRCQIFASLFVSFGILMHFNKVRIISTNILWSFVLNLGIYVTQLLSAVPCLGLWGRYRQFCDKNSHIFEAPSENLNSIQIWGRCIESGHFHALKHSFEVFCQHFGDFVTLIILTNKFWNSLISDLGELVEIWTKAGGCMT